MARQEVVEDMDEVEETQSVDKDRKYFTATVSKVEDVDFIERVGRIQRIGGFSIKELFALGVEAAVKSDKYQKAIKDAMYGIS